MDSIFLSYVPVSASTIREHACSLSALRGTGLSLDLYLPMHRTNRRHPGRREFIFIPSVALRQLNSATTFTIPPILKSFLRKTINPAALVGHGTVRTL